MCIRDRQLEAESAIVRGKNAWVASIDLQTAFDMVKREVLMSTSRETGLNNEIIQMIEVINKMDCMKLFLEEELKRAFTLV